MPTESCPICKHRLPREFLATHMTRAHPDVPVAVSSDPVDDASSAPPSGAYQGDLAEGLAPPESVGIASDPETAAPAEAEAGAAAAPEGVQPPPVPTSASQEAASEDASPVPPPEPVPESAPSDPSAVTTEVVGEPSPLEDGAPAEPAPPAAATPAPGPAAPVAPPTPKELRSWLVKHRHRTGRALERAEAWCEDFSPRGRRR